MRSDAAHLSIVKSLHWGNELATRTFAERLAGHAGLANALIELRGDLGVGKTTLVRHLLRALGVTGRVKSPTYALVEVYELVHLNIWHFDFFRLSNPQEVADAGFAEIFANPGLKLVEWPEKAGSSLPPADLVIELTLADDESRQVALRAQSERGKNLLQAAEPVRQEQP